MAEMIVEGVNGTIKLNETHVFVQRKPGVSLVDYIGDGKIEFELSEIVRLDYKKPSFFNAGYFRFIFKGEKIPEVAVPARKLSGDRHSVILKAFDPTNVPDADKMYNAIQEVLLGKKATDQPEAKK